MCGAEGRACTKYLRLAWWGADGCTSGGQSPACLLGGGGGGWLLTRALSPSSSIQGSLPQPPPVDVMAVPALSCCLSLLVLLLLLAIPQTSTAVNGEDPGIWRAGLSLRREAEALLELVLRPLLGRSPISRGRRWGKGANGTRVRVSTFSLDHPVYTVSTGLSETLEDNVFLSLPCLDQSGGPCRLWDSVLSSLKRTH